MLIAMKSSPDWGKPDRFCYAFSLPVRFDPVGVLRFL